MKKCKVCEQTKPLEEFYKVSKVRSHIGDGHVTLCKSCSNARAKSPEQLERNRIRDKKRAKDPKRLLSQRRYRTSELFKIGQRRRHKKYRQTEHGHAKVLENDRKHRKTESYKKTVEKSRLKYPEKRKAQYTLSNALRTGKIKRPNFCSVCNKSCKPQGHHYDYSKPLNVIWMCKKCHSDLHWSSSV